MISESITKSLLKDLSVDIVQGINCHHDDRNEPTKNDTNLWTEMRLNGIVYVVD